MLIPELATLAERRSAVMSKKRYTLYLSRPLARRFEEIARQRNGAKSALVEEDRKSVV